MLYRDYFYFVYKIREGSFLKVRLTFCFRARSPADVDMKVARKGNDVVVRVMAPSFLSPSSRS